MSNDYTETLNHEMIHARQQVEMAWIFFFAWYAIEFLIKLVIHRDFFKAYLSVSFEREAYRNDRNPLYLTLRKPFSWIKCISG